MPIINTNTAMLFELADCFGTSSFAETFTTVYERFRYRGATRLQWKALKNIFNDVFTGEDKDAWRSILRLLRKTCITFPTASEGISFLFCRIHRSKGAVNRQFSPFSAAVPGFLPSVACRFRRIVV